MTPFDHHMRTSRYANLRRRIERRWHDNWHLSGLAVVIFVVLIMDALS